MTKLVREVEKAYNRYVPMLSLNRLGNCLIPLAIANNENFEFHNFVIIGIKMQKR